MRVELCTMTRTKLLQHLPLLLTANPNIIYLRDGEVVVYRRSASPLYQCRYKLADGKWHRVSTRKASAENAVSVACLLYNEARFRQRLGLAHTAQTFAHIADEALAELRQQIDIKGREFERIFLLIYLIHNYNNHLGQF